MSIIQAVNRIRCRRVIDAEGNCPPSDVFIVLPKGRRGDRILAAIRLEMPGIVPKRWSFSLGGEIVRVRKNSSHDALVAFMRNWMPGNTSMSTIQKELGLTAKTVKNLKATLRDAVHPLTVKLRDIGVNLVSSGYGKSSKTYLSKV